MSRKPPRPGVPSLALVPKPQPPTPGAPSDGDTMGVELAVVFAVDGKGLARATFTFEVPRPPPGEGAQLAVTLDGAAVLRMLEPLVGPRPSPVATPPHAGLWVPGKE